MMDRKEALEWIELTELATPEEIKAKLASKLTYFETLSEKAPSQFVRRLHQRNVERVKEIMAAAKSWEGMEEPAPEPVVTAAPEPAPVKVMEAQKPVVAKEPEPAPVVAKVETPEPVVVKVAPPEPVVVKPAEPIPVAAKAAEPQASKVSVMRPAEVQAQRVAIVRPAEAQPPKAKESQPAKAKEPQPIAWLIRHTENQSTASYPIYSGKTYIGRKEKPGLAPFVRIGDDPYISKFHAVILAEPGRPATFYLADDAVAKGEKPSTNGTYLNGRDGRITAKTQVRNNDTIQLGITKLVFRISDAELEDIVKDVANTGYMHTVIIDIK
jgi:hypothetical protein